MTSSSIKIILTSGFAMFSMFFGSGNLVFPIEIGIKAQHSFLYAILGFVVTGVCLPFLGLMGIMQFKGDRKTYFRALTPVPAFILTFIMLALMGPLGIVPRCALLSHGTFLSLMPTCPLWVFNALFCVVIGFLIWQRNRIVEIIGIYLTPIKLGGFILLIIISLLLAKHAFTDKQTPVEAFTVGLRQGYQTLDLIASFFFGSTIYEYIRLRLTNENKTVHLSDTDLTKKIFNHGILASLFGGALLSLCYVGFVLMGAKYAYVLEGAKTETFLMLVSGETLGSIGTPFVALTLIVSCLATASVTSSLFADFLYEDILKKSITRQNAIILTLAISYALSLIGFSEICAFLGSVLEWMYPFLMLYAIIQMVRFFMRQKI